MIVMITVFFVLLIVTLLLRRNAISGAQGQQ
jgi:hypothetical protein